MNYVDIIKKEIKEGRLDKRDFVFTGKKVRPKDFTEGFTKSGFKKEPYKNPKWKTDYYNKG